MWESYLGPSYGDDDSAARLTAADARFHPMTEAEIISATVTALSATTAS